MIVVIVVVGHSGSIGAEYAEKRPPEDGVTTVPLLPWRTPHQILTK
jgi:hypothetical protein